MARIQCPKCGGTVTKTTSGWWCLLCRKKVKPVIGK